MANLSSQNGQWDKNCVDMYNHASAYSKLFPFPKKKQPKKTPILTDCIETYCAVHADELLLYYY